MSYTREDMYNHGYSWVGMRPLTKEEAIKAFKGDYSVCFLYEDDTEGYIVDLEEIEECDWDGVMFGIEDIPRSEYLNNFRGLLEFVLEAYPADVIEVVFAIGDNDMLCIDHCDEDYCTNLFENCCRIELVGREHLTSLLDELGIAHPQF